jgi:outer membrane lipase/esterase
VSFDGFNEHGSLVPLDINGTGQSSLRYDVGGQLYFKVPIGKTLLVPTLKVAFEHECEYSALSVSATAPDLNNATATFFGPSIGRNSVIINAGASLQITPRIWLTITYDGQQARSHYNANGVDGVISFSF